MIKCIKIQKTATYDEHQGETLSGLSEFNFIYGANGTGKTTISRVIADESKFTECELTWKNGNVLETLVYNCDFVKKNFDQPPELKGIFTLGENKDTIEQINNAKIGLEELKDDELNRKCVLEGKDGSGGKKNDLKSLEDEFQDKCWDLKLKYDELFQTSFTGVRGKKSNFKSKLLDEEKNNSAELQNLEFLKNKAQTLFGETPQEYTKLSIPSYENLLNLESAPILKKKVIGKEDVDIAAMIQKLSNSDWVEQGRAFYDVNNNICPFCQQETKVGFTKNLNAYFDETFKRDIAAIKNLLTTYQTNSKQLQQNLQFLLDNPSNFFEIEKLKIEKALLDPKIDNNLQAIKNKQANASQIIELASLKNELANIERLIDSANKKILVNNTTVSNLVQERKILTDQVWKFLLEEIKNDLNDYFLNKKNLEKAIESLNTQIEQKRKDYTKKDEEIKKLEKNITSIQPTINTINKFLQSFGFTCFSLAKSEQEGFYKIQRSDGSDAKETLSEGEKSFITFLYFYHLLKGSESETGIITDRIVVFDDPVSSFDSDILFIVRNLITGLFEEVRDNKGYIKQIFILTHNVYFYKEITFNPKRRGKAVNKETFWIVRKLNHISKIKNYDTNPIKNSYELLWSEIKNIDHSNISIQNILRRIIEYYFKILGNIDIEKTIFKYFAGQDILLCKSLFSWVHDGSHSAHDNLYISTDNLTIERYLKVFKEIFKKAGHKAHYDMMMGEQKEISEAATS